MAVEEEVTQWIAKLGRGDADAARLLWQHYFSKLVEYARHRLAVVPRRAIDEEDVALSAMNSFCQGMAKHRFDQVNDRNDLWKLLVTITARKAWRSDAATMPTSAAREDPGRIGSLSVRERRRVVKTGSGPCWETNRHPNWQPWSPRTAGICWTVWGTIRCGKSPC